MITRHHITRFLGITWIAVFVIGIGALLTLSPLLLFACVIICPTAYIAMLLVDPEPREPVTEEPPDISSVIDNPQSASAKPFLAGLLIGWWLS